MSWPPVSNICAGLRLKLPNEAASDRIITSHSMRRGDACWKSGRNITAPRNRASLGSRSSDSRCYFYHNNIYPPPPYPAKCTYTPLSLPTLPCHLQPSLILLSSIGRLASTEGREAPKPTSQVNASDRCSPRQKADMGVFTQ